MFKSSQSQLYCVLRIIVLWFFSLLAIPTYANIGINWLASQAQPDGSYSTSADLAMPFQATTETWRTFAQMGQTQTTEPSMTVALDFINAESFASSEYLTKILVTKILAGQVTGDLVSELTGRLQFDGGLGDAVDYDRSVLDTALALEALAMASLDDISIEELNSSIDFLLRQQHESGGWADNDNETSVYVTAIVMRALWHYRHQQST